MAEAGGTSYHTHNHYCDGIGEIAEMIEAAIAAGLSEIGISSHAPLPFATGWTMPPERLEEYAAEVREMQRRYGDRIKVYFGAEIDYIPNSEVTAFQERAIFPLNFDYFVGSVHFLGQPQVPRSFDDTESGFHAILTEEYAGDISAMVTDYYQRMSRVPEIPGVRIIGHLDRIKRWNAERRDFTGDEPWYRAAIEETLRALAGSGTIVELNTSGWRKGPDEPYPAPWILARCRDFGIPITINSDAHSPAEVDSGFDRARALLADLGITPVVLG